MSTIAKAVRLPYGVMARVEASSGVCRVTALVARKDAKDGA